MDFFGTTIKVRNPALAKLLNGGAVQDVVVFGGGDVQASLGQDVSDTSGGS